MSQEKLEHPILYKGQLLDSYEELMFHVNGAKAYNVKVPFAKPDEIIKGAKFWAYNTTFSKFELITITYVRIGIAFYTSSLTGDKEDYFPIGCVYGSQLEPELYVSDRNPKYYNFVADCKQVAITYAFNEDPKND